MPSKMPGSSRLPVSLRDSMKSKKIFSNNQLLAQNFEILRNILAILFLLRYTRKTYLYLRGYGIIGSIVNLYVATRRKAYGIFLSLPGIRQRVTAELATTLLDLEKKMVPSGPGVTRNLKLPAQGMTQEQIFKELDVLDQIEHSDWKGGKVSGAVYHGGDDLAKLQTEAYGRFALANPIHPDAFPGVRKMEAEVVAMVLALFNAPDGAAGVSTSGGTESILMAVLSARQKAYHERGITEPEMILPSTAHTAFHKAGSYFGIKVHLVDCPPPTWRVHIPSVARLINKNTILLVGSAPNYPHGIIDDIPALSRLALRHPRKPSLFATSSLRPTLPTDSQNPDTKVTGIPLHVDCCLGSFLVPLLGKAGFETPSQPIDFRCPGVTSISCDTHKYGFAPKGNSVVLYRNPDLRRYQYFVYPNWSGGVYASPSIAGSRPGALIAGCWASMMNMGESGYIEATHKIVGGAKEFEQALRTTEVLKDEFVVIGKPMVSVVAFMSARDSICPIYDVADAMGHRGWNLNALQDPPAIHVAVTLPITKVIDVLVQDLVEVTTEIREREIQSRSGGGGSKSKKGDKAMLYGVAGSLPNKGIVVELANGFLDTLYKA